MRAADHRPACTLIIGTFLLFMLAGLYAHHDHSFNLFHASGSPGWLWVSRSSGAVSDHPIPALMANAKDAFAKRLAKQSRTLAEAVAEYKRRYGRDPPRGFDHWYTFAIQNDFKFVDEFDAIAEDLAPFWALSAEELRKRALLIGHMPSIDIVRIQNGDVSTVQIDKGYDDDERGHRTFGFHALLEKFQHMLPDMDIPINGKAEGRVLVPWEHIHFPNATLQDTSGEMAAMMTNVFPDWRGEGNVWEAYRRTCPPETPARQLYTSYRGPDINIKAGLWAPSRKSDDPYGFIEAVPDINDFCKHPWAHYTQGHFFSDWRTVSMLFPVFSPAKSHGFADIRIPSHYYSRASAKYTYAWNPMVQSVGVVDKMEVPWEQKKDIIFWRGATTGGGSTPPGFTSNYHRHRFLRMTHESVPNNVTVMHASPASPRTFVSTAVPAKSMNQDIMDVAFVGTVGSYHGGDDELRKYHRFADSVPLGKHWAYKYLIDLDGMSYSGRFMALLASDSAVLKSTMYTEYFSDWIQPWLHYIPVSSSYAEIYNIHAYFSGPSASVMDAADTAVINPADWEAVRKERDAALRLIGKAGKQWKRTIGRTVDMEVYVYRLCLEYGRLWADDRDAMNFVL